MLADQWLVMVLKISFFTVKKMSSLLPAPSSKPLTLNIPPSKSQSQNIPPSKTMISNTQMKAPPPANNNIIPSKHRTLTDFNSLDDNGSLIKDKKQNVEKVKDLLDSKSGVSDSMKDELISVLVKRPNGVWANRLSFEYKVQCLARVAYFLFLIGHCLSGPE